MENYNFNKKTDDELKGTELDYEGGKLNIIDPKTGKTLIDRGENKKVEDKKDGLPPHKLSQQNLEDIKNGKTPGSPEKYKVAIVDNSSGIESQAEDIAEARMAKEKKNTNWIGRIFKHNLARAAYKQVYIQRARKAIMESGNLYAGETGDATQDALAYEESKKGTVGRYLEEYAGQDFEKGVHTAAGELRTKVESKSPEEIAAKAKIEELLKRFASGGGMTEEQFLYEKDLVLKQVYESNKEQFDQGKIFNDNLLEVAKKVKENFSHNEGLAKLDLDFDLIIGRARSGVRTEAQMTALNKIVEKVNNKSWGALSLLINETTVGVGGALAVSLVTTIAKSKLSQWATFGASVLASGSIAYAKEKWRLGQERKQHTREMAKGRGFEDDAERRKEMEKYRYATRDAKDLISSLAMLSGGVELSKGSTMTTADLESLKPLAEHDGELAEMIKAYKSQLEKVADIESELKSKNMRVDEKARGPKQEELTIQKKKLSKLEDDLEKLLKEDKFKNDPSIKKIESNKIVDIKEKIKSGEMTPEQLNQAIADLADIEARIKISDEKKIDLISFSSIKDLENERWALDKARANAKYELRKLAEAGKLPLPAGRNFDQHLESLVQALENSTTGAIGKDISEKDKTFTKMKNQKALGKGLRTVGYGLLIGATLQEGLAMLKDNSSGLLEHALKMGGADKSDANLTPVASLWSYITGQKIFNYDLHDVALNGGHMKLPWDMTMTPNPDGTFNLMRGAKLITEHLKINPDGSLTDEARKALGSAGILSHEQVVQITDAKKGIVSTKDFLNNHSKESVQIHRGESALGKGDMHFDNNTPVPKIEQNELGLHYGHGGTGINPETGHYSYDIRSMTESGSFHGSSSLDVIAEAERLGHPLKMLIALDRANPFKVFEVLVRPDGTIDIDPNSEVGKLAFKVVGGHLQFIGGTAEIAHSLGVQADGIEKFNIIATQIGKGIPNIEIPGPDTAVISTLDVTQGTDMPWFAPVMQRTPLEPTTYKEKKNKEDKGPKSEGGIEKQGPIEARKEGIEKIGSISAKEITLAEKIIGTGATLAILKEELAKEKDPATKKEIQKAIIRVEKDLENLKKNKEVKSRSNNPLRKIEKNIMGSKAETVEEKKDLIETLKVFRNLAQSKNSQEFEKLKKDLMATNAFKKEASLEVAEDMKEMTLDNITDVKERQQAFFHGLDLAQKGLEAEIAGDKVSAEKYAKEFKELDALEEEESEEENKEDTSVTGAEDAFRSAKEGFRLADVKEIKKPKSTFYVLSEDQAKDKLAYPELADYEAYQTTKMMGSPATEMKIWKFRPKTGVEKQKADVRNPMVNIDTSAVINRVLENAASVSASDNVENPESVGYEISLLTQFPEIRTSPHLKKYLDKFIKRDLDDKLIEDPKSNTQKLTKLFKEKLDLIKTLEKVLDPKMDKKDFDKAISEFNKGKKAPTLAKTEHNISFGNINEKGGTNRQLSIKIGKDGEVYLDAKR